MAPYRSNRSGARPARTAQIDHDVFEGLPVRHWRKKATCISSTSDSVPTANNSNTLRTAYPELPLPRDFSILPENSQALLRAARMGIRKEDEGASSFQHQSADSQSDEAGILATKWTLVPRDMEGPEPEYLAKRRKGLPSVYNGLAQDEESVPMRKTKVRTTNANGETQILEALVPIGQSVENEVTEELTPTKAPAPGTHIEGLGVVNADGIVVAGETPVPTSVRRRPPIPYKRKKRGPGRGRKKIIPNPSTAPINGAPVENQATVPNSNEHDPDNQKRDDAPQNDTHADDEDESDEGSDGEDGEEGSHSPSPNHGQPLQDGEGSTKPSMDADHQAIASSQTNGASSDTVKMETSVNQKDQAHVDGAEGESRSVSTGNLATIDKADTANAEESHQQDQASDKDDAVHPVKDPLAIDSLVTEPKTEPIDVEMGEAAQPEEANHLEAVPVDVLNIKNPPPIPETLSKFPAPPHTDVQSEADGAVVSHQESPMSGWSKNEELQGDMTFAPEESINVPAESSEATVETKTSIQSLLAQPESENIDVEAAPHVQHPTHDAEIPHNHNPLEGLAAPEVPPEERRLRSKRVSGSSDRSKNPAPSPEPAAVPVTSLLSDSVGPKD